MAGCGFDADVVHRCISAARRPASLIGPMPGRSSKRSEVTDIRICVYIANTDTPEPAAPTTKMVARWAFVINLPCYAGGLNLAHEAVAYRRTVERQHASQRLAVVRTVVSAARRSRAHAHAIADYRTGTVTRVRIESQRARALSARRRSRRHVAVGNRRAAGAHHAVASRRVTWAVRPRRCPPRPGKIGRRHCMPQQSRHHRALSLRAGAAACWSSPARA